MRIRENWFCELWWFQASLIALYVYLHSIHELITWIALSCDLFLCHNLVSNLSIQSVCILFRTKVDFRHFCTLWICQLKVQNTHEQFIFDFKMCDLLKCHHVVPVLYCTTHTRVEI
jgi:hypothetical protein